MQLRRRSTPRSSECSPVFKVSALSHLRTLFLCTDVVLMSGNQRQFRQAKTHSVKPTLRRSSKAPLPHFPSAPKMSTLRSSSFLPLSSNLFFTSLTKSSSRLYKPNPPSFPSSPSFLAARANSPIAAPANPAWKPNVATLRPSSPLRYSRS